MQDEKLTFMAQQDINSNEKPEDDSKDTFEDNPLYLGKGLPPADYDTTNVSDLPFCAQNKIIIKDNLKWIRVNTQCLLNKISSITRCYAPTFSYPKKGR